MPTLTIRGAALEVLDTREGDAAICFSHGLLWSHRMYAPQIARLRDRYRCIAWDHRGQGRSEVPPGRVVSIEAVTADAITLIEQLGVGPVHFVGLSMGGFVGMRLAARRPDLVRSLSLLETAPDPEPQAHLGRYRVLTLAARLLGVNRMLADRVLRIMCADAFLDGPDRERVDDLRAMLMENGRDIYKAVNGVLEGVEHEIGRIRCPTLVLRGTGDNAIARERSRLLVDGIEGARWVEIEGAGHTSTLEAPDAVTDALEAFIRSVA